MPVACFRCALLRDWTALLVANWTHLRDQLGLCACQSQQQNAREDSTGSSEPKQTGVLLSTPNPFNNLMCFALESPSIAVWSHTSNRTLEQQSHRQTEHQVCWGNPAQECTAINKRRRSWNLSRITRDRWRHGARGPFSIWWRKETSALAEFGRRRRWRRGGGVSPSDWEVELEWVAAHSRESLQYCWQLRRWRRPGRVWVDCQCNTEGTL